MAALVVFAFALTRVDTVSAGRAYAAYGGVYILASMAWMRIVEGLAPDWWDAIGVMISLTGAAVILFSPRR